MGHVWTITGSDNDLSPGRHQAIIWTNAKLLGAYNNTHSLRLIELIEHKRWVIELSWVNVLG